MSSLSSFGVAFELGRVFFSLPDRVAFTYEEEAVLLSLQSPCCGGDLVVKFQATMASCYSCGAPTAYPADLARYCYGGDEPAKLSPWLEPAFGPLEAHVLATEFLTALSELSPHLSELLEEVVEPEEVRVLELWRACSRPLTLS